MSEPKWQDRAVCRDHPADLWFPDDSDHDTRKQATQICHTCPVEDECLTAANTQRERYGVWGGLGRDAHTGQPTGARGPKKPPTPDHRCGTDPGYSAHRRRNENPCPPCLEAGNYASRYRRYGADTR